MTGIVLYRGGWEANWLAAYIMDQLGTVGIVAFKFGLVIVVVIICEYVGRRRRDLGRRLATWAIILPAMAVLIGAVQLLMAR